MEKYIKLFGEEWFNLLKPFIEEGNLDKIAIQVNRDRKKNNVLPEKGSPLLFRAFKELQPSKIKVILLGMDIYHTPETFDGLAFSCGNTLKPQPSLANIIKEIESEFPDNFEPDRADLTYLLNQGVFLVNTGLTVIQGTPGSHIRLWRPFTKFWIEEFSKQHRDVVWLLLGTHAKEVIKQCKIHPSHGIVKGIHPSPLSAYRGFFGSGIFQQVNEELNARNKKEILW